MHGGAGERYVSADGNLRWQRICYNLQPSPVDGDAVAFWRANICKSKSTHVSRSGGDASLKLTLTDVKLVGDGGIGWTQW